MTGAADMSARYMDGDLKMMTSNGHTLATIYRLASVHSPT
jgi:hypothetical protein